MHQVQEAHEERDQIVSNLQSRLSVLEKGASQYEQQLQESTQSTAAQIQCLQEEKAMLEV